MARTIIHIGMPRAASTYFQQALFRNIQGFKFYGVETCQYSAAFQNLLYQDESLYCHDEIKNVLAPMASENCILSNELFVGQSLYLMSTNRWRTAKRLSQIFPEAEILLIIRNQVDLLKSLYAMAIYSGLSLSPEEFIKLKAPAQEPYPTFEGCEHVSSHMYTAIIKAYSGHFKKIHIMLFEDFADDKRSFIRELKRKLGLEINETSLPAEKVNRSLSYSQIRLLGMLNRWKPLLESTRPGRSLYRLKARTIEHYFGGKKSFALNSDLSTAIKNYYLDDNKRLIEFYPDLETSANFKKYYF